MNTSKQINVMIGLLFLAFIGFGAYIAFENSRAEAAREAQREMFAARGAELFVLNCANCHGTQGMGADEGAPLAPRLNRDSFRILRADNPYDAPETPTGEAQEVRDFLFNTISCGRRGTIMPVWNERYGGPLSDIQINYIVTMITEGRWDLVDEAWHHYLEEIDAEDEEEAREEFILTDAGALSMTEENCGQFTALTARPFHERNPFDPDAPPPDDDDEVPDALVQGLSPGDYFLSVCAACHGQQREGGIGPPLTPQSMTQEPSFYEDTLREGRPGTPMAPYGGGPQLSDEEVEILIEYLMNVEP